MQDENEKTEEDWQIEEAIISHFSVEFYILCMRYELAPTQTLGFLSSESMHLAQTLGITSEEFDEVMEKCSKVYREEFNPNEKIDFDKIMQEKCEK